MWRLQRPATGANVAAFYGPHGSNGTLAKVNPGNINLPSYWRANITLHYNGQTSSCSTQASTALLAWRRAVIGAAMQLNY
jgi:hypothetical protein